MPDQSINWLRCYQQLVPLTEALAQANSTEAFQSALQLAKQLHNQLQQISEENLASAMAQLSFIPPDEPVAVNRTIKSWVLLCLWAKLKHWPKSRRDLLGISVLLAGSSANSGKIPAALALAKRLKQLQTGGIFTTLLAGTYHRLQKRQPWQVHHDSPMLTLALTLGTALQPDHADAPALEQLIGSYLLDSNDEFELAQLKQLTELAPMLFLCGRVGKDKQDRYWLLCFAEHGHYHAFQYWPEQQRLSEQLSSRALEELTLQPPLKLMQQHWLARVHIDVVPANKTPTPNELLDNSILATLSHHDITAQQKLLEKHPAIAQLLLENATASNRQQLPVNNLRHALASFGQEQLPMAVAQAELLSYLQLQGSNQHSWLLQLKQTLYKSLLLLSKHTSTPLMSQQAGLLATCCSAPLWHHPSLQAVPLSRVQQEQLLLGQLCQKYLLEPVKSQRLTAALLHHYQQDDWAEAALFQYIQHPSGAEWSKPEQLGLLLRLSWQLTFSVFCFPSGQQSCQKTLQVAAKVLPLPETDLAYWQQQLLACEGIFFPLDTEYS